MAKPGLGSVTEPYEMSPAQDSAEAERELKRSIHQTVKKVTEDMEKLRFNTMVAALMEFTNYLARVKEAAAVSEAGWNEATTTLLLLMAPSTPHLAEELWQMTEHEYSIHNQEWPKWDEKYIKEEEIVLVVQINGKLRDRITVPASADESQVKEIVMAGERVKAYLGNKKVVKTVYVPRRLINLVISG